jgi:hypothetical protein
MATQIGAVVLGGAVMVMSLGVRMVTANSAYSAAQRGALSTVEMLSKEIPTASKVEIIPDESAHNVSEGLANGWHYVALDPGRKEARYVYQVDDARFEDTIPGSEYIEALSFDTEVFPDELNGGGRLLRVSVAAAYGTDDVKRVDLDKTILIHAATGVTGESDDETGDFIPPPSGGGRILRYLPEPLEWPLLEVYGSESASGYGLASFNYDTPDTWKNIEDFNPSTELDARLTLPPKLLEALHAEGKTGDDVVFSWIAVEPTVFETAVGTNKNPRAILKSLQGNVQK